MALVELVDKLIREHGSSSISKEHIELLREEARATEEPYAREITDANTARAKEVLELKSAHEKELVRLRELHAQEMTKRERLIVWLLLCGSIWGLGIALCVLIIERLYFR